MIRTVQGLAALRGASLARRPRRRLAALVAGAERCAAAAGYVAARKCRVVMTGFSSDSMLL